MSCAVCTSTCNATGASSPAVKTVRSALRQQSRPRSPPALAESKHTFVALNKRWAIERGSRQQGVSESVRPVSVCRAGRDDVEQSYKPVPAQPPEADHDWVQIALWLFVIGFFLGPLLDGIHSGVGLQEYDAGAVDILGLKTDVWVGATSSRSLLQRGRFAAAAPG